MHKIAYVEITKKDLPLSCPSTINDIWNKHPRVFLPIKENKEIICPYCSTVYKLVK